MSYHTERIIIIIVNSKIIVEKLPPLGTVAEDPALVPSISMVAHKHL